MFVPGAPIYVIISTLLQGFLHIFEIYLVFGRSNAFGNEVNFIIAFLPNETFHFRSKSEF